MSQDRQHPGEQEVSQGSYATWWLEAEIQRQREQEQQADDTKVDFGKAGLD